MIETLQSEVATIVHLFIAVEHTGFYRANKITVLFRRPGLEARHGQVLCQEHAYKNSPVAIYFH